LYNVLLFILTWGVTCILALAIVPAIHEVGHAAACLTQGNSVTHLQPLPFGAEPDTGCTQIMPLVCAAGPLTTAAAWLLCTYSFRRLAVRLTPGHLFTFLSALWLWWSVWAFGEFVMDAYSDVPLHHDTGYFVHLIGINPAFASATMFVAIAVLSVPPGPRGCPHAERRRFRRMSNSILGNARLRQLAVMMGGVGTGPFFLRLCTALGVPLGKSVSR